MIACLFIRLFFIDNRKSRKFHASRYGYGRGRRKQSSCRAAAIRPPVIPPLNRLRFLYGRTRSGKPLMIFKRKKNKQSVGQNRQSYHFFYQVFWALNAYTPRTGFSGREVGGHERVNRAIARRSSVSV